MQARIAELEKKQPFEEQNKGKLFQEQNLLRTLIDNLPDCIFVKDLQGRVVTVNIAGAKSVGKDSPDEVKGKTDYDFHPYEMAQLYHKDESKVLQQGESIINTEYLLYHECNSHKPRWYNCTKVPLRGFNNEIIGLVGISRDITTRKKMQQELQDAKDRLEQRVRDRTADLSKANKLLKEQIAESKKFEEQLSREHSLLRTLIDNVPDLIYFKNMDGHFMISNKAFTSFLGKESEQEVLGKTNFDFLSQSAAEEARIKEQRITESGQSIEDQEEVLYDHATKQKRWFSTTRIPVENDQGKSFGLISIGRDITDRRLAEEHLIQFREEMIHAERLSSLGTVSAVMAHELNQPLTVIRLFLQQSLRNLNKTACSKTVLKKLQDCLVEVSNSIDIITRFRNFTRISHETTPENMRLREIVDRVTAVLSYNTSKSNISIVVNVKNFSDVAGDISDMEQLFFIFIENAIQAADREKPHQVFVSASTNKNKLILKFEDDCGGMDAETKERIFEPFFTTKPFGVGTGLGLSIAKDIVFKYGGKIDIESTPGKGSLFTVTLPRKMSIHLES